MEAAAFRILPFPKVAGLVGWVARSLNKASEPSPSPSSVGAWGGLHIKSQQQPRKAKASQGKPSQGKPSKPSKPSQVKPRQAKASLPSLGAAGLQGGLVSELTPLCLFPSFFLAAAQEEGGWLEIINKSFLPQGGPDLKGDWVWLLLFSLPHALAQEGLGTIWGMTPSY